MNMLWVKTVRGVMCFIKKETSLNVNWFKCQNMCDNSKNSRKFNVNCIKYFSHHFKHACFLSFKISLRMNEIIQCLNRF